MLNPWKQGPLNEINSLSGSPFYQLMLWFDYCIPLHVLTRCYHDNSSHRAGRQDFSMELPISWNCSPLIGISHPRCLTHYESWWRIVFLSILLLTEVLLWRLLSDPTPDKSTQVVRALLHSNNNAGTQWRTIHITNQLVFIPNCLRWLLSGFFPRVRLPLIVPNPTQKR